MIDVVKKLIGNTDTKLPNIDFNSVVKTENLSYWSISKSIWKKDKVKISVTFKKNGIESSIEQYFDTIMEAVEYFYNFLKTL